MTTYKPEPCRCPAYPFPHRRDGGDCSEDSRTVACSGCDGYGVLAQGPYGEEPECRRCRGSGEEVGPW